MQCNFHWKRAFSGAEKCSIIDCILFENSSSLKEVLYKKIIPRWYKDDRKMADRWDKCICQKDDSKMSERWQKNALRCSKMFCSSKGGLPNAKANSETKGQLDRMTEKAIP